MKTNDFSYTLPDGLIAQYPLDDRTSSRLMVYYRDTDELIHTTFNKITDYLNTSDILVLNDSRVIPARLFATTEGNDTTYELLLLRQIDANLWKSLIKPYKKVRVGLRLKLANFKKSLEVSALLSSGNCVLKFPEDDNPLDIINKCGSTPLPPYIKRPDGPTDEDVERYQTVFARYNGSVAAPTSGLHFTPELLTSIEGSGVEIYYITLHIGYGTFKPIKTEELKEHIMEEEYFTISRGTARGINTAILNEKKVIACGTSMVRALETSRNNADLIMPGKNKTELFIYPGYEFKIVDGLLTNFHLPRSTTLTLVSAFIGRERLLELYKTAIKENYRFYSYGDAMLIL